MIVAICSELEFGKKPFLELDKAYVKKIRSAYEHLLLHARKKELTFFITNFRWYDKKTKKFSKGWTFDGAWKVSKNVVADAIWDKSPLEEPYLAYKKFFFEETYVLNPYQFGEICSDKVLSKKMFKKFLPFSLIITKQSQINLALTKIKTSLVVIKPAIGASAEGVLIEPLEVFKKNPPTIDSPHIVEEFIKAKKKDFGFPYEVYDLRIVVLNGKLIDAYYRVSPRGVYTSNLSTGGKIVFESFENLSLDVLNMVFEIDKKIKNFNPRLYTVDLILGEEKPYLIEVNAKPGFMHYSAKDAKRRALFENAIIDEFLKLKSTTH